jgi:type IV pilus assembly protein PilW
MGMVTPFHPGTRGARDRGFSLVELLVALLIGLIGTIVIFQVYGVSEGYKRTTTGAGDAQQNGVIALFSIERDARMAGYGLNYAPLLGCKVNGYDAGPPVQNFSFRLVPVTIVDGAIGAPDTVSFVYANSTQLVTSVKLLQTAAGGGTTYQVDNRFGFTAGDLLIAGEVGKDCTLAMATGIPVTPSDTVARDTADFIGPNGAQFKARYNKPGGLGVDYTAWNNSTQTGGRLFDIGSGPSAVTYSVQNSQLTFQNVLGGTAGASVVVDGIVQLQAQYGWDINGDGAVTAAEWTNAQPVTSTDWSRILAIRVAVVSRSSQPERPDPSTGVCTTTTVANQPKWTAGNIDVSADPNWQCYRYRVFETVVPLRNQIWFAL